MLNYRRALRADASTSYLESYRGGNDLLTCHINLLRDVFAQYTCAIFPYSSV